MPYIATPSDDANAISDAVISITQELAKLNHTLVHIKERLESIDDSLNEIRTAKKCEHTGDNGHCLVCNLKD